MTFLIASPFVTPPPPLEGAAELTEAGLPEVLRRAQELLTRMRADLAASRASAAATSDRLEDTAAALSATERNVETAGPVVATAAAEFRRAGDERQAHWGGLRLQAARNALRVAEDEHRDQLAGRGALERAIAAARQRADFLAVAIERAKRQASLLWV